MSSSSSRADVVEELEPHQPSPRSTSSSTTHKERKLLIISCISPWHFLLLLVTFLIANSLLQIHLSFSPSPSSWSIFHQWGRDCSHKLNLTTSRLRDMITFLPLKDASLAETAMDGNSWFMSSLNDTRERDGLSHLRFPSEASNGKLLCLVGGDTSDGTKNSYAVAWPESLPLNATLLGGLTFVSDSYFDYNNIWHGLAATLPFVYWHKKEGCVQPSRWVLYHWGELRTSMGKWVRSIMEAAFGQQVKVFQGFKNGAAGRSPTYCFEEAVVFRHNEGGMSIEKRRETYDMLRCKARRYCNISSQVEGGAAGSRRSPTIRMTLYLRSGARSFKNESAVITIFRNECEKVDGCRLTVSYTDGLLFCDQVKLMSGTDILVSPHGAQLTNMFLMDRNSSVMEFFPYGWEELAGAGQYVYHWMAGWSGMRHQGAWRDPNGEKCPYSDNDECFISFYKSKKIGHDELFFGKWASSVLNANRREYYKLQHGEEEYQIRSSTVCSCG